MKPESKMHPERTPSVSSELYCATERAQLPEPIPLVDDPPPVHRDHQGVSERSGTNTLGNRRAASPSRASRSVITP